MIMNKLPHELQCMIMYRFGGLEHPTAPMIREWKFQRFMRTIKDIKAEPFWPYNRVPNPPLDLYSIYLRYPDCRIHSNLIKCEYHQNSDD